MNGGNFYHIQEWIIDLEQYLKQLKIHQHKKPTVAGEIRFLYQLYTKLVNMDVQNIDNDEGLFYQFAWDSKLYSQLRGLLRIMRKYSHCFEGTRAIIATTDIPIDFQEWETLATNGRGMLTIVEDPDCYTILYSTRATQKTRQKIEIRQETVEITEHTAKSCKNQLATVVGAMSISTFHKDVTVTLRKTRTYTDSNSCD